MWRHSPFWEGRVEVGRGSKVGGDGQGDVCPEIMVFGIQAKASGWEGLREIL